MDDRYDEQNLLGYVEGDLNAQTKDRFDHLMVQDPRLRALVDQLLDDRQQLRGLVMQDPPAELMEQISRRLERNMLLDVPPPELNPVTPHGGYRLGRLMTLVGLAAMVLVSIAVVLHTLLTQNLYDQFVSPADEAELVASDEPGDPMVSESSVPMRSTRSNLNWESALVISGSTTELKRKLASRDSSPPQILENSPPLAGGDHEPVQAIRIETFARLAVVSSTDASISNDTSPLARKVLQRLAVVRGLSQENADQSDGPAGDLQGQTPSLGSKVASQSRHTLAQRVQVYAADPQAVQQALLVWAVANKVLVLSLGLVAGPDQLKGQAQDGSRDAPVAQMQQVTVGIDAGLLSDLIAALNHPKNQSAQLIRQIPRLYPWHRHLQEDHWKLTLRPIGMVQWGTLLAPHMPLEPVVPLFAPDTQLVLTVEIYPNHE